MPFMPISSRSNADLTMPPILFSKDIASPRIFDFDFVGRLFGSLEFDFATRNAVDGSAEFAHMRLQTGLRHQRPRYGDRHRRAHVLLASRQEIQIQVVLHFEK